MRGFFFVGLLDTTGCRMAHVCNTFGNCHWERVSE